jgi:glycosyltransferase involved in cell wall biosynthesis
VKKALRVALCTDYFYPSIGGVQSHVAGLASELERRGHEVAILARQVRIDLLNGFLLTSQSRKKVIYVEPIFPLPIILVPPKPAKIREVISRGRFDIVHAHHAFTPTSLLSISSAEKLRVPSILTNHTIFLVSDVKHIWVPTSYILYPYRRYINKASLITAVSEAAAKFIEHFAKGKEIVVVPNGVDVERFTLIVRKTISLLERPTILYVGRLVYRKGLHVLVRAMPFVLKEIPDAQLLIVGEGYMDSFLRMLIKSLNLEENVKMLGFIPDEKLSELYTSSHLFVLPSLYCESFGITLLEAMASGRPIVASNVGGIPEVVEDGVTGLLFRRGDAQDLADKIIKVLNDNKLAQTLAFNARKLVKERYSWTVIASKVEDLYEKTLNSRIQNETWS